MEVMDPARAAALASEQLAALKSAEESAKRAASESKADASHVASTLAQALQEMGGSAPAVDPNASQATQLEQMQAQARAVLKAQARAQAQAQALAMQAQLKQQLSSLLGTLDASGAQASTLEDLTVMLQGVASSAAQGGVALAPGGPPVLPDPNAAPRIPLERAPPAAP